jgi:hypothetical protein
MGELLKILKELGPSALVGFVLGLGAIWWVEPLTPGGDLLVMLVTIVVVVIVGSIFRALWKLATKSPETSSDTTSLKSSELKPRENPDVGARDSDKFVL